MAKNIDNTKKLIEEMKQMLGTRKVTCEGLVYGEDGEEMMNDGAGAPEPQQAPQAPEQNPEQQVPQGVENNIPGINNKEENPLDGDPEITKLITSIRVMTLKGLTKLANNPETAQYDLLKKIFLQIDKSVEDKINPEK